MALLAADTDTAAALFTQHGVALLAERLPSAQMQTVLAKLQAVPLAPLRGGIRRIEQIVPEVAALAASAQMRALAACCLPAAPQLVRVIYFDKSPAHNWAVAWHQDKTVAVSAQFAAAGWGPWSMKAGVWHVQAPLEVLQDRVTLRLHLDPATRQNGCLQVIPGSHRAGLLTAAAIAAQMQQGPVAYCEANRGAVLLMHPLLLHASAKASVALPRRILHFEYASHTLPPGIHWAA